MKQGLKRSEVNYVIDIIIGAALVVSIASGILLLFFPSGEGFRGGRNSNFTVSLLGMNRWVVKDVHTISSIAMSLGVLGHLILHWKWIMCMTGNIFKRRKSDAMPKCELLQ